MPVVLCQELKGSPPKRGQFCLIFIVRLFIYLFCMIEYSQNQEFTGVSKGMVQGRVFLVNVILKKNKIESIRPHIKTKVKATLTQYFSIKQGIKIKIYCITSTERCFLDPLIIYNDQVKSELSLQKACIHFLSHLVIQ